MHGLKRLALRLMDSVSPRSTGSLGEARSLGKALKTGSATLSPGRIQQIQQNIPGGANVPIIEIR